MSKIGFYEEFAAKNADDTNEKQPTETNHIELEIENESSRSKSGLNKSSSEVPFLNAEDTSNSKDLYPNLSKDSNETRVI